MYKCDCFRGDTFYGLAYTVTNANLETIKFSKEKQSCLMHRKQILRKVSKIYELWIFFVYECWWLNTKPSYKITLPIIWFAISTVVQDIDLIQKNKMKEMDELVDLELRKNEYEQQLENSLLEIKKMSELLGKLKRDEIT